MKINNTVKLTSRRIKFIETYNDFNDQDILKELLYTQQLHLEKLEKVGVIPQY